MIVQSELSQEVGRRVWASEDSGPLPLSLESLLAGPTHVGPLRQLSQSSSRGARVLDIDTLLPHASLSVSLTPRPCVGDPGTSDTKIGWEAVCP